MNIYEVEETLSCPKCGVDRSEILLHKTYVNDNGGTSGQVTFHCSCTNCNCNFATHRYYNDNGNAPAKELGCLTALIIFIPILCFILLASW